MNLLSKLTLGTAQFGFDYGVTNHSGQIPEEEVHRILSECRSLGINSLDTAPAYGDSEERIGRFSEPGSFQIISKISANEDIEKSVTSSINKLGVDKLYGVLFHSPKDLIDNPALVDASNRLKELGLVEKVGVSIYDSETLNNIRNIFKPDIVQLPLNLFDQRVLQDGTLANLSEENIEIHARSIFLQGILLTPTDELPDSFDNHLSPFRDLDKFLQDKGINRLQACLNFALKNEYVDNVLFGISSMQDLKEITQEAAKPIQDIDYNSLALNDDFILDPLQWSL